LEYEVQHEIQFEVHYFEPCCFSLEIVLNSFVTLLISKTRIIISGIIERNTAPIKNCPLFQKSAPSITAKSKKANKFAKISRKIRKKLLYIKN